MPKAIDMTGWVMSEHGVPDSRLTVIKEVEPHYTKGGHKQRQFLCKCTCIDPNTQQNTLIIVKGQNLRNGNTKSCGCIKKEKIIKRNIEQGHVIKEGERYGKLIVLKDLGFRQQQSRNKNWRWSLCQCDCGNIIEVPNNMLRTGWKKSCGCIASQGEFIIEKLLKENDIQYIKQYKFSDLKGINNGLLRFDFAIFFNNNLQFLIEWDGRQHYTGPEAKWTQGMSLKEIQLHDQLKNDYCKKNNLILKRIPYTIKDITIEDIFSDKFNI